MVTLREDILSYSQAVKKGTGSIRDRGRKGVAIFFDRGPKTGEHIAQTIVLKRGDGSYEDVTHRMDEPVPENAEIYYLYIDKRDTSKLDRHPFHPDRVYHSQKLS